MNKLLIIVSMLACFPATAAPALQDNPPPDWNGTPESYQRFRAELSCRVKGEVFKNAAELRDQGGSPEWAYPIVAGGWLNKQVAPIPGIDKEFVKQAINMVYFDPAFINAGGQRLASQVEGYCLRDGKPQFKPLK